MLCAEPAVAPGAPLARRRVRAPGAGARTGKMSECKRRDDRGDRMYHPIIAEAPPPKTDCAAAARAIAAGPFKKSAGLWGVCPSWTFARPTGQRTACPFAACRTVDRALPPTIAEGGTPRDAPRPLQSDYEVLLRLGSPLGWPGERLPL